MSFVREIHLAAGIRTRETRMSSSSLDNSNLELWPSERNKSDSNVLMESLRTIVLLLILIYFAFFFNNVQLICIAILKYLGIF